MRNTSYQPTYDLKFDQEENKQYQLGWQSFVNGDSDPSSNVDFMFKAGYYEASEDHFYSR